MDPYKELDTLLANFKGTEGSTYKTMKALNQAREQIKEIYRKGFEEGLNAGLKKLKEESK